MDNYSKKNYLEIFYIMMNTHVAVKDFCHFFKLNYYKYRIDMNKIAELAPFYGIKIELEDESISYSIIDPQLFNLKIERCVSFYHRNKAGEDENISLIGVVGQLILLNHSRLTIEQICDLFGYSRSGIKKDLNKVKDYISSYEVKIRTVPYYGLIAEGNEFNLRACLLSLLFISERELIKIPLSIEKFNPTINQWMDLELENQICRKIASLFERHHLSMPISNIQFFVKYLLIQKERLLQGHPVDKIMTKIYAPALFFEDHLLFQIAEEIYDEFIPFKERESSVNQNEIMTLALMLLLLDDHPMKIQEFSFLNEKAGKLVEIIHQYLIRFWGINLLEDHCDFEYVFLFCKKLIIKDNFHILSFKNFLSYTNQFKYLNNPLVSDIMSNLRVEIKRYFNLHVRGRNLNELSYVVIKKIYQQRIEFNKIRIAFFSHEENEKNLIMMDMLKDRLNEKYIESFENIIDTSSYLSHQQKTLIIGDRSTVNENTILIDRIDAVLEHAKEIQESILKKITMNTEGILKIKNDCIKISKIEDFVESLEQKCNFTAENKKIYFQTTNKMQLILCNYDGDFLHGYQMVFVCGSCQFNLMTEEGKVNCYVFVAFNRHHYSVKLLTEILRMLCRGDQEKKIFSRWIFITLSINI